MGMQVAAAQQYGWLVVWHFVQQYWPAVSIAAVLVAGLFAFTWQHGPDDTNGNGIVVGAPKVFDSRALTLRLEQLNKDLNNFKIDNSAALAALSSFQAQSLAQESTMVSVTTPALLSGAGNGAGPKGKNDAPTPPAAAAATVATSAPAAPAADLAAGPDFKPAFGLAAADIIASQLNYAARIFNQQMLNEGSLSDRIIGNLPRMQTVLGFQVSITPPDGYRDCVAVLEAAVQRKSAVAPMDRRVSVIALMPQENTYNAESVSGRDASVTGSGITRLFTLGLGQRSQRRETYITRESETIAFERAPGTTDSQNRQKWPRFGVPATVFGWEFRPVLGRRTVAAGTRQVLAVIAVPEADESSKVVELEVSTRSYWRRYDRKLQTTRLYRGWLPWRANRSATHESVRETIVVPSTECVQESLAPVIKSVSWTSSGPASATVVVTGKNFFSGTKVFIGGQVLDAEPALTLKSEHVLEFQTTLESLTSGDALVSGRYGPSQKLLAPRPKEITSLEIASATIRPLRNSKTLRISVDVTGRDERGNPVPLTTTDLLRLPQQCLFVGDEAVPAPYDYIDRSPDPSNTNVVVKYVRVEAWISSKQLAKNPSVSFRIPFCGLDYQASEPLSFAEPTLQRLGSAGPTTIFRLYVPQASTTNSSLLSLDLDKTYNAGMPELTLPNPSYLGDYRFKVATSLVDSFDNVVVRVDKGEPTILPIPRAPLPPARIAVDSAAEPCSVVKGKRGAVEWKGWAFDTVTDVSVAQLPAGAPTTITVPLPLQFAVYANGSRLVVYLPAGVSDAAGRISLNCRTSVGGELLPAAVRCRTVRA